MCIPRLIQEKCPNIQLEVAAITGDLDGNTIRYRLK